MTAEAIVATAGLTKRYGPVVALDGLDLEVPRGVVFGLLGPNGAGKTTLLHTLLGFYKTTGGTARVFGRDIRTETREIRSLMGYMPESDAFIAGPSADSPPVSGL